MTFITQVELYQGWERTLYLDFGNIGNSMVYFDICLKTRYFLKFCKDNKFFIVFASLSTIIILDASCRKPDKNQGLDLVGSVNLCPIPAGRKTNLRYRRHNACSPFDVLPTSLQCHHSQTFPVSGAPPMLILRFSTVDQ